MSLEFLIFPVTDRETASVLINTGRNKRKKTAHLVAGSHAQIHLCPGSILLAKICQEIVFAILAKKIKGN